MKDVDFVNMTTLQVITETTKKGLLPESISFDENGRCVKNGDWYHKMVFRYGLLLNNDIYIETSLNTLKESGFSDGDYVQVIRIGHFDVWNPSRRKRIHTNKKSAQ